jgi:hypothetical protein
MKLIPQRWKAAYEAGRGRPSDSRAVVPFSNNNNQVVLPPVNSGRQYHRRICAPSARVEVETTRQGKRTTYYFDQGYADEMWWEES